MRRLILPWLVLATIFTCSVSAEEVEEEEQGRPEWVGVQLSHHVSLGDNLRIAHTSGRTSRESISDLGTRSTQLYRIWVRPLPLFSIRFFWSSTLYRDAQTFDRASDDHYGGLTLTHGDRLDVKLELEVADLDFVFHPLTGMATDGRPGFDLEAGFGLRRVRWSTSVEVGGERESDHVRVVIPTLLLGMIARPLKGIPFLEGLELFARGRLGGSAASDTSADSGGSGSKWNSVSGDVEAGVSWTFAGIVGVTVGYRLDYFKIRRTKDPGDVFLGASIPRRVKQLEGTAHGPFVGLVLQY